MAVLALLAGWLVAGRMLRPIRTITATARRISATNLRERLALDRADEEFKRLGDTLDDLFARLGSRLRGATTLRRQRLPRTTHPPHRGAQPAAGRARRPPHQRSRRGDPPPKNCSPPTTSKNTSSKPSSPWPAARADSTTGNEPTWPTSAKPCCPLPASTPTASDCTSSTAIHPAPLDGDPRLIERLVANLVDNAIGHNLRRRAASKSRTDTTDGQAVLTVTNTGPVIPPDRNRPSLPALPTPRPPPHPPQERPRPRAIHRPSHRHHPPRHHHRPPPTRRRTHRHRHLPPTHQLQQDITNPTNRSPLPLAQYQTRRRAVPSRFEGDTIRMSTPATRARVAQVFWLGRRDWH